MKKKKDMVMGVYIRSREVSVKEKCKKTKDIFFYKLERKEDESIVSIIYIYYHLYIYIYNTNITIYNCI